MRRLDRSGGETKGMESSGMALFFGSTRHGESGHDKARRDEARVPMAQPPVRIFLTGGFFCAMIRPTNYGDSSVVGLQHSFKTAPDFECRTPSRKPVRIASNK